jgi:hypothetical protein
MEEQKKPPLEWRTLTLNWRAWEYITMLDDYDAGKLIKMMLSEEVWIKNEELSEDVFEKWSKQLQIVAMMWNENLFNSN